MGNTETWYAPFSPWLQKWWQMTMARCMYSRCISVPKFWRTTRRLEGGRDAKQTQSLVVRMSRCWRWRWGLLGWSWSGINRDNVWISRTWSDQLAYTYWRTPSGVFMFWSTWSRQTCLHFLYLSSADTSPAQPPSSPKSSLPNVQPDKFSIAHDTSDTPYPAKPANQK